MTASKAMVIVVCFAFLGTAIGALVGYGLGSYAPDFIAALFPLRSDDADVAQIGVGLGLVNGGFIGVGVGTLVMGILTWQTLRTQQLRK